MPDSSTPFLSVCPRCGGSSQHPFAIDGVCLRCAGVRVLTGEDFALPPPIDHAVASTNQVGQRIGRYEIIEEIGHGGMGRVFAARQIGLGRIVALKALPEGRGGVAGLELRFLREAETAARLRHPHIVSVHDSGRADGHVYFTMDYIDGGDLARRLRENPFTTREAAVLLEKVARALAYTHGQGVLHRDLKPSNILLDGDEPRLADFGLAAQLEAGGDLTQATGVLGTPHYVAPEALRGGSAALTEASDLYALGVVLYEMLTGRTPFAGAMPAQLPSLIENEPALPLRLLAPSVPRDLETICLKCLEREPARRYGSATALADDLQRFLAGEPIRAHAPGPWENFTRFARRHRFFLSAAAAIALTLIAATLVSLSLAIRARRAEHIAATEARTSKALAEFLQHDLLAQAAPDAQPDRDIKLLTVLERASAKVDGRFTSEPQVAADIRETLAATLDSLGDFAGEEKQLRQVIALRTQTLGPDDAKTLHASSQLASCLASQGKLDEASHIGAATCARLVRILGIEHPETLHALNNQVYVVKALGRLPISEALARRTLAVARRSLGADHEETRVALSDLSSVLWTEGRLVEAEQLNTEALAAFQRTRGPEHPETLSVMSNLASVYWSEGKLAEAEQMNRRILDIRQRILGPEHPETLRSMNNLATVYTAETKYAEATGLLQQNLAARRKIRGPEHADTLSAMHNLAQALMAQGQRDEAIALCHQAQETAQRVLGAEHFITQLTTDTLAGFYFSSGRQPEGRSLAEANLAVYQRLYGPDNPKTILAAETLAKGLLVSGDLPSAESAWRDIVARRQKAAPESWRTHSASSYLGEVLMARHQFDEAEQLLLNAFAGLQRVQATIPPNLRSVVRSASERIPKLYRDWGRADKLAEWQAKVAAPTPAK